MLQRLIVLAGLCTLSPFLFCIAQKNNKEQTITETAVSFLNSLSLQQREKVQLGFTEEERFNWHFIPRKRKGLPIGEMTEHQKQVALSLLKHCMSNTGYVKTTAIIQLESVLREVENRPADDTYRNPDNYYFTIFGNPASDSIWAWRLEGHHVSLNFSTENNKLVSGTPGFFGANPAVVLSGPEKGMQVLKDETEAGITLFRSLNQQQQQKALIDSTAPVDIITSASRQAMIKNPQGILYNELTAVQRNMFLQLLSLYIHRYTRLLATQLMHQIEMAGLGQLRFAWAGDAQTGPGHPHYYRIQGPTIIIEYDNTQNNANHIHTVIRDLSNDFGGDELLEHYNKDVHR